MPSRRIDPERVLKRCRQKDSTYKIAETEKVVGCFRWSTYTVIDPRKNLITFANASPKCMKLSEFVAAEVLEWTDEFLGRVGGWEHRSRDVRKKRTARQVGVKNTAQLGSQSVGTSCGGPAGLGKGKPARNSIGRRGAMRPKGPKGLP